MPMPIRLVACAFGCTLALPVLAQPPGRVAMPDGEGKAAAMVETRCERRQEEGATNAGEQAET